MAPLLLRIEHADPGLVDDILTLEAREWRQRLHWNREPVRRMSVRLAAQRTLPGWLLVVDGKAVAKVVLGIRRRTRALEFPYVAPAHRGRGHLGRLLEAVTAKLQADPGVDRVEIGFFLFGESEPVGLLRGLGLGTLPRQYMMRDLDCPPVPRTASLPRKGSVVPWGTRARLPGLLHAAYQQAPDRDAVDLYANRSGCALYLAALVNGPACGTFAPDLSARAVDSRGRAVGFLLATRVSRRTAHIAQIAIHPDWQGLGLGTGLLDRYAAGARESGAVRSSLLVSEVNARARSWYERRGYRSVASFCSYWWERSGRPLR